MDRVRDYGGFVVWFMGFGYLVGWALIPDRVQAMPAGMHAMGLTAVVFLPVRAWTYFRDKRKPPIQPLTSYRPVWPDSPPRPRIKPRNQFGLRGVPPKMRPH
ncbi:MAG: hypothetical protein JO205_14260 [Pseudolabrys sp.]|nr:hypothetical protein [Pseudolabrys sp.]MBV9262526.1 hypothetical protein [Pseudolabrys sp.]